MPELPEVEIVTRNLSDMMPIGEMIKKWHFFRSDLRFNIPKKLLNQLKGIPLKKIDRRAKYILFDFGSAVMISHLGMTGSWRQEAVGFQKRKHDHLAFEISGEKVFVYEDARRFGFVEVIKKTELSSRFKDLGVEPLAPSTDFAELTDRFLKLDTPIKTALMNQKYVVGVGNIYASEVLYRAGVNPFKTCSKLGRAVYEEIWKQVVVVLKEAINKGGSSIENYRNGYGETGNFQESFFVYGRKTEVCRICHTRIKTRSQSGRSTFWCPNCQK